MHRTIAALAATALCLAGADALARGDSRRDGGSSHHASGHLSGQSGTRHAGPHSPNTQGVRVAGGGHGPSKRALGVKRGAEGRIQRSTAAKSQFQWQHPCPSTGRSSGACPGYVIDHMQPLKRGGADEPSNMQWQTTAAAKAKDKTE